jgi:hypothetical protein
VRSRRFSSTRKETLGRGSRSRLRLGVAYDAFRVAVTELLRIADEYTPVLDEYMIKEERNLSLCRISNIDFSLWFLESGKKP